MYNRVIALCRARGITVRQLEQRIGVGNGIIAKWKNGNPSFDNLCKVAGFFGITLDELVYGKGTTNSHKND